MNYKFSSCHFGVKSISLLLTLSYCVKLGHNQWKQTKSEIERLKICLVKGRLFVFTVSSYVFAQSSKQSPSPDFPSCFFVLCV